MLSLLYTEATLGLMLLLFQSSNSHALHVRYEIRAYHNVEWEIDKNRFS